MKKHFKEQREVLIKNIPKILKEIDRNKDIFISDAGKSGEFDHGNGEKFSITNDITELSKDGKYFISYRLYCSVVKI